jgi:hypothetical protein
MLMIRFEHLTTNRWSPFFRGFNSHAKHQRLPPPDPIEINLHNLFICPIAEMIFLKEKLFEAFVQEILSFLVFFRIGGAMQSFSRPVFRLSQLVASGTQQVVPNIPAKPHQCLVGREARKRK